MNQTNKVFYTLVAIFLSCSIEMAGQVQKVISGTVTELFGKTAESLVGVNVNLVNNLVEEHFKRPVILINYPKDIKAFYMKQNDDGKTVRAMDVLFPGIGEIIGSLRVRLLDESSSNKSIFRSSGSI